MNIRIGKISGLYEWIDYRGEQVFQSFAMLYEERLKVKLAITAWIESTAQVENAFGVIRMNGWLYLMTVSKQLHELSQIRSHQVHHSIQALIISKRSGYVIR